MKAFTYDALPGRVVFGVGAFDRLTDEIDALGAISVLVVTGGSAKSFADEAITSMGGRYAEIFPDVEPHVPIEIVERATKVARNVGADCVVTIGGGSATGFGKIVALETGMPAIAVPTTYSGSEMTPIYGITSNGLKRTTRGVHALPKTVIYDPALTVGVPASVTGASGMNALAHCVESLYSRDANPITSIMAEEGIRALAVGIPASVATPANLDARSEALYGAYLAGATLAVAGMAIHHRICHVLGGTFGLVHAQVNAVILPQAAHYNASVAPEAMASVARALGADDGPEGLFDLVMEVGAPTSLADLGMREGDLDRAASLAVDPPPWNPRPVDEASIRALLDDAYQGRRPG
jgi:Alcohol dehydrogenase, class IV